MENKKPIIYSSPTCPYCDMAKEYFKGKGIDFEERSTTDPENRKKLVSMGIRGVPAIFIGEEYLIGFDAAEIERLMAKSGTEKSEPLAQNAEEKVEPANVEETPEEPKEEIKKEEEPMDLPTQKNRADYEPVPKAAEGMAYRKTEDDIPDESKLDPNHSEPHKADMPITAEAPEKPMEESEEAIHPENEYKDEAMIKGTPEGEMGISDKWVCTLCGYVYDPAVGDDATGIAPGTTFEQLPEDWVCPLCGAGKDDFERE